MVWDLLRKVLGPEQSLGPIDFVGWRQQLEQARALMDSLEYRQADALLCSLRRAILPITSPPVADCLAEAMAAHGECQFQLGQVEQARQTTLEALQLTQPRGDPNLQIQLWGNLLEVHRYLGQQAAAAQCADQLVTLHVALEKADMAERCRRYAAVLRRGEPPLRVVVDLDGQRCEIDELLAGQAGAIRFVYARDRLTLRRASALTDTGESLAHQGRFDEAL